MNKGKLAEDPRGLLYEAYQIDGISSPKYGIAEGWAGATLQKNSSNIVQVSSLNSFGGGPNAFGQINLFSANSSTTNSNGDNHNTKLFINKGISK